MKLTRLAAAAGLLIAAGVGGVAMAGPAAAYPTGTLATATINATVFTHGSSAVVTVNHFTPGGSLSLVFKSNPVQIGSGVTVGSSGTATISGTVPTEAALGSHEVTVSSTKGESITFAVTVVGPGGNNPGGPVTGTDNGNLAGTGAAVTGIGILGGVLVAGGVFFVVMGRRRTVNEHTAV